MRPIDQVTFVCIDCETTGLDLTRDRIIEIGIAIFQGETVIDEYTTLLNPLIPIPDSSSKIHSIKDEMLQNKPLFKEIAPHIVSLLNRGPIIGHQVSFDLSIIQKEMKIIGMDWTIQHPSIDTLRLARAYGKCPFLSLEGLCSHFYIPIEKHHRAMNDVRSTITLFRKLTASFPCLQTIQNLLEKPIEMETMPLGEYRGLSIKQIPLSYLKWAIKKKFDLDLHYSLSKELQRRRNNIDE
ncbi:putative quorum-sensing-regulated virulence factor [Candidatus Similichlamydia epinepheli]|uniref:putative quorum-sensing-regulated virulence factor n=1 Tax=Candidatus Similichlamydia epinepheli TaxID=1903953 RepID=UPI00130044D2|nr:DUF3820 family protein [Candidatus Similichlamydia epinepheli]